MFVVIVADGNVSALAVTMFKVTAISNVACTYPSAHYSPMSTHGSALPCGHR